MKFQAIAKISQYDSVCKNQKPLFSLPYLAGELQKLLKKHKYHYVGVNNKTDEIIAYACFDDSIILSGSIDLILVFKDEDIRYNKVFKYLLLLTIHNEFPDKRVFACLNKRDRFEEYVNFMKKSFNINLMKKDEFGRVYIEFLK